LLERYRPRIYLAEGQTPFLDFYADYIAKGKLKVDGRVVSASVGPELLNKYKDKPDAEFVYQTAGQSQTQAVVFAKLEVDTLEYQGQNWPLSFLSYNLVFAHSGLLADLPMLARWAISPIADLRDWHQLDHYVGVTVALHQGEPIAYTLQQHNYQTTYIVSRQKSWPSDQRVAVDVALRSNELYPHSPERVRHPGVSFVSEKAIEFVLTGKNKPLMAGWDITHGQIEQDYRLQFLAPDDAFYQFKGRLGESRKLPGRDGPPGADYVTLPGLMRWSHRLVAGFRPGSVEQEKTKLLALIDEQNFRVKAQGLEAYKRDFIQAWEGED